MTTESEIAKKLKSLIPKVTNTGTELQIESIYGKYTLPIQQNSIKNLRQTKLR